MADLFPICPHCGAVYAEEQAICPVCGEATEEREDTHIGMVINGAYAVHEMIGQGAIGRVYRATQLSLKKTVAIKMLHAGFSRDDKVKKRFHREALAASRINHPNAVAVFEFGESQYDRMFLAMEFIEGHALADEIGNRKPMAPARVAGILIQVLGALGEAHAGGVIHRDIKPENIMLQRTNDGSDLVKVLDFGIAQFQTSEDGEPNDTRLTRVGHACGTPGYMSPEQARTEDLDPRADLYSIGVVMYEALTGSPPFEAPAIIDLVAQHLYSPVPAFSKVRTDLEIPEAMEAICLRALAKKPEDRFESAGAMAQALEAVLADLRAARQRPAPATDAGREEARPPEPSDDLDLDDETVVADPAAMRAAVAQTERTGVGERPAMRDPAPAEPGPASSEPDDTGPEAAAPAVPARPDAPPTDNQGKVELPRLNFDSGDDLSLDEKRQWKVAGQAPPPGPAASKEAQVDLPSLEFGTDDDLTIDRAPRWKPSKPDPDAAQPEPRMRPPWEPDESAAEGDAAAAPPAKPAGATRPETGGSPRWPVFLVLLLLVGAVLFFTLRGRDEPAEPGEPAERPGDPTLDDVKAATQRAERLLRGSEVYLRQEVERQAGSKKKAK